MPNLVPQKRSLNFYCPPSPTYVTLHPCCHTWPPCTALYTCTVHTGTVQLYTTPTHVAPMSWGRMPGGDVFEFIINCMSLLNIAHARHCPHRSRWLPWPVARIISTKTVTRAGDAEQTLIQNTKSGMKVYLASVVAAFVVLWEIFICGVNTGTIRDSHPALTQTNLTKHG